jgi:hypothetical protein
MYEIWLMMNIAWELLLPAMPVVVALILAWVALMLRARFSGAASWGGGLGRALLIGLVVAVVAFFTVPGALKSSLSEMGYWADWLTLLGLSVAAGAVVAVLLWPILSVRRQAH